MYVTDMTKVLVTLVAYREEEFVRWGISSRLLAQAGTDKPSAGRSGICDRNGCYGYVCPDNSFSSPGEQVTKTDYKINF